MKYRIGLLIMIMLLSLTACGMQNDPPVSENGSAAKEAGIGEEIADDSDTGSKTDSESETTTGNDMEAMSGIMVFGIYPQSTETAEAIEWIVLDRQDDRMLLLAKDCIDSLPWHNTHENITWDNSDIRAWLNGEFLQTAFTKEEQENILLSDLDNGDDLKYGTTAGMDTQDRFFLLSAAEVEHYLPSDNERTVRPTNYAVMQGAYTNGNGNCAWWLRSPGMTETSPAYIASAGSFGNRAHEVDENIIGVRPAMWIKIN